MIPSHLIPKFDPVADPDGMVELPFLRITILTPIVFRIEYNPNRKFEDRPSQVFWYRNLPVPKYSQSISVKPNTNGEFEILEISTSKLSLNYTVGKDLSAKSLSIHLKGTDHTWHYGDQNLGNLKGTYRTLDNRDGQVELENGLLSKDGWTLIDDSQSLVFNQHGWLETRNFGENYSDLYFFGYGYDFTTCIRDYRSLTGPVPLLPRWVLGNWWSRYWAYDQNQIMALIQEFQDHEVPLSVIIIDMDWHITETGNESSGWTGYTWNRELFPDPPTLIRYIHERGLKTALNLHPAGGVYPHEARYKEFAEFMGLDPCLDDPIPFDLADPKFTRAYFEILHHPLEADGLDFWWIDWQQGEISTLPGLDPLFWLNHLHFLDLIRLRIQEQGVSEIRPFVFSRWGGLGNHRYPIGFSGDTIVSWDSLAYQPFFTATAANVCYGWWSHDIGGHMSGIEDPELYTRWIQFGVLSPIFRLHSTNNPYHERRPFAYDAEISRLCCHAMRLRHSFIPYLYSMAWLDHQEAITPIRPMYHLNPESEPAYFAPDTYTYGTELVAAPYTSPMDTDTRLSRQKIWLPEGNWFDYFSGKFFTPGHHVIYGDLVQMPLFAKAGAIIPVLPLPNWGGVETPSHLRVNIFPGADNQFSFYDDDGNSTRYLNGNYALTEFCLNWEAEQLEFIVSPASGNFDQQPKIRKFEFKFWAISNPAIIELHINQKSHPVFPEYNNKNKTLTIPIEFGLSPTDTLDIRLQNNEGLIPGHHDPYYQTLESCINLLNHFRLETYTKSGIVDLLPEIIQNPELLARSRPTLKDSQLRALLETITRAGVHRYWHTGEDTILVWNENPIQNSFPVTYHLTVNQLGHGHYDHPYHYESGPVPNFKVFHPSEQFRQNPWELSVIYGNVLTVRLSSENLVGIN